MLPVAEHRASASAGLLLNGRSVPGTPHAAKVPGRQEQTYDALRQAGQAACASGAAGMDGPAPLLSSENSNPRPFVISRTFARRKRPLRGVVWPPEGVSP
jgi:hypothetical protein